MYTEGLEEEALKALAGVAVVAPAEALEAIQSTGVSAEDFEDGVAGAVFSSILQALSVGQPWDAQGAARMLREDARQLAVRMALEADYVPPGGRLRLLVEASKRRGVVQALEATAQRLRGDTLPAEEAVALGQKALTDYQVDTTAAPASMADSVLRLVADVEDVQLGKRLPVLPTGIKALDAIIGGLPPTLCMVGALPGVGKSALLAGIIRNLIQGGTTVGLLSLEDEKGWLPRRLVAEATGIPLFKLATQKLGKWELERLSDGAAVVHNWMPRILCEDTPGMTRREVTAVARRMARAGAKAIFVDHLGEIRLRRSERHDLDIIEVLQDLRNVAKMEGVPMVVAAHLKRRDGLNVDTEPRLTDFAFSSGVERMARLALGLWKEDGQLSVAVLKQTQGMAGVSVALNVNWRAGVVTQTDASPEARRLYDD